MNLISRWLWKRAIRREILFVAKITAWISGILFIISGITNTISPMIGMTLGLGMILLAGRLDHRTWSAALLIAGFVLFSILGGAIVKWGASPIMIASVLGRTSTFF